MGGEIISKSEYLTPKEIGEVLNVSGRTIIRLIEAGDLKAVKVGSSWRVLKSDFQAYLDENSNQKK